MTTITHTHDEWTAEAERLFGDDALAWAFKCPQCRTVSTCADFKAQGAAPHRAAQECIGRVMTENDGEKRSAGPGQAPCDWAAFGLLRGPNSVIHEGKEVWVFEFADGADQ